MQDHWEWAGGFSPGLVSHPQTITLFVSRYSFSLFLLAMRWDMWGLNQWPLLWTVLLVRPRGEESLNHPITREVLVCFFLLLLFCLCFQFLYFILFLFLLLPVGLSETSNTMTEDTMVAGSIPFLVGMPRLFLHHIFFFFLL